MFLPQTLDKLKGCALIGWTKVTKHYFDAVASTNMAETSETQRGPGNPSSEVITENNNLRFDSSDDEAPEEVNFEDSKRSALQSVKDALEASRR